MFKKLLFFFLSMFASKTIFFLLRKIVYFLIIFFFCGILFHFWLYPKIEQNKNLKSTFNYFKFLNTTDGVAVQRIKFDDFYKSKETNDTLKFLTYLNEVKIKKLNKKESLELLKKIKFDNRRQNLISDLVKIEMYNNSANEKYIEDFKKDEPLYYEFLENKILKNIKKAQDVKGEIEKISNKYPELKNLEILDKIKQSKHQIQIQ